MSLSREDARSWHMTEAKHYNGGKDWFAYLHRCVEQPRLSRFDKYIRATRVVKSTWRTDGLDQPSIEAAIEALNTPPSFDASELDFMATCSTTWTDKVPGSIDWEVNESVVNKGAVEWRKGQYRLTELGAEAISNRP